MYTFGGTLDDRDLAPGTNVLVSGPPLSGKRALVRGLLHEGLAAGEGAIVISTQDTAPRVRSTYRLPGPDVEDSRVGILDCVTEHIGQSRTESDLVKYAGAPKDLSGVEIAFSEFIESFYGDRSIQRNRVVLDSITTLLLYANLQQVFHFLHSITSRIEEIGAVGVFVIDSSVHDEQTLATVRRLFDGEIETSIGGSPSVRLPDLDETSDVVES